jgi:uncharacterized membrane protein YidH (DUF202 family)
VDDHGYVVQIMGPRGWLAPREEHNAAAHAALCRPLLAAGRSGAVFHPGRAPDDDHYVTCVPLAALPGYGIALERAPDGVVLLSRQLRRLVLIVGGVLLLGAAVVTWLDVQRVVRPLSWIAEAERMRGGDLRTPVRLPAADAELTAVGIALEQLRAAVCASFPGTGSSSRRSCVRAKRGQNPVRKSDRAGPFDPSPSGAQCRNVPSGIGSIPDCV